MLLKKTQVTTSWRSTKGGKGGEIWVFFQSTIDLPLKDISSYLKPINIIFQAYQVFVPSYLPVDHMYWRQVFILSWSCVLCLFNKFLTIEMHATKPITSATSNLEKKQ